MTKIDRAHKNYVTSKIWEEMHLRETFYGTLIFQQSSVICIGHHVRGHSLALQHGGQTTFCLYLVKCSTVTLRCAVNITTWSFQHLPWSLSAKFVFRKRYTVHNYFKNDILVMWPATNLLHFKKMVRVWKTKSLLFCLRYDPLIVFQRQSHITFICIKIMSHDLLVQVAFGVPDQLT